MMYAINEKELLRLLKELEIPTGTDSNDGRFKDLKRLIKIQEEIDNYETAYKHISGKGYYRLYGQDNLMNLSKKFDKIVLVSSHADNWQAYPRYEDRGETINGIFDNASTNAVCVYLMKNIKLPENVLFAFTSDEECNSTGAKKLAKKLSEYFDKKNISVIVLDVTYGWCDGADFTIENDFIYKGKAGETFIDKICSAANDSVFSWKFIKAASGAKQNFSDYIPSEEIAARMGKGCIGVSQYWSPYEAEDETAMYDEFDCSTFSLCLPCSANNCNDMHSDSGFEISKKIVCNYTEFLSKILVN